MGATRLVIIGAGIAGLTAGVYAARSGYRPTILEMGQVPGGLCTSWRRKGYLFDGSVAGLAGTSPEAPIYRLWRDIGVVDYCPLYDPVDFGTVVAPDGRAVTVFTDIDRLEAHLLENFPVDAAPIGEFTRALRSSSRLDIPFRAAQGLAGLVAGARTGASSLRSLRAMLKYGRLTLRQFNARLQDPFCRQVFDNLVHFGGPDVPMLTVLLPIAYAHRRMTGIPRDGWLAFGRAVERRFLELGGEVRYGASVERLETRDGAVRGVGLAGGEVVAAGRVLWPRTAGSRTPSCSEKRTVRASTRDACRTSPSRSISAWPRTGPPAARSPTCCRTRLRPPAAGSNGSPCRTSTTTRTRPGRQERADRLPRVGVRVLEAARGRQDRLRGREARVRGPGDRGHRPPPAGVRRDGRGGRRLHAAHARALHGQLARRDAGLPPGRRVVKALLQGSPRYDEPGLAGFYSAGQWVESWGGVTTAAQSGRSAVRALCKKDGARFAY